MGFSSDHTLGSGKPPVFPNASRTPWFTAETGFHSANVRRTDGKAWSHTKAFEMKVSGKITMNDALLTTSTLATLSPTYAMIHEIAYANISNKRKPQIASRGPVLIRQPTISPVMDMTSIEVEL